MNKQLLHSGILAILVSICTYGVFSYFEKSDKTVKIEHITNTPSKSAVYSINEEGKVVALDFHETASAVIDGVVHIKSTQLYNQNNDNSQWRSVPDPFRDFFGEDFKKFFYQPENTPKRFNDQPTRVGTGSGVIVSEDGYIITNNHVVANADDIEVTLHDNSVYKALVIGTDPSTDLALLQIKAEDLPVVPFVDSDNVKIGQWVLAVGNPMGLNSTVTAGIVSAKGRNINILKEKYAVENFIQTDAAINPGNSGGALVNLEGGLVGINTAIASPTGTFAGYGFAIPANIVAKVMEDLIKFGSVQRGVLGIMIRTMDGNFAKEKKLDITRGVYVDSLMENSAAGIAGIMEGDVILRVNDVEVNSSPELQGEIAQYRPGDKVDLLVFRKGKEKIFNVTLTNKEGNTKLLSEDNVEITKILGIVVDDVSGDILKELDIKSGVKVNKIFAGKIRKYTQMREGFIITHIDGERVKNKESFINVLQKKEGGVMLEGVYEDIPGQYYYAFGLGS